MTCLCAPSQPHTHTRTHTLFYVFMAQSRVHVCSASLHLQRRRRRRRRKACLQVHVSCLAGPLSSYLDCMNSLRLVGFFFPGTSWLSVHRLAWQPGSDGVRKLFSCIYLFVLTWIAAVRARIVARSDQHVLQEPVVPLRFLRHGEFYPSSLTAVGRRRRRSLAKNIRCRESDRQADRQMDGGRDRQTDETERSPVTSDLKVEEGGKERTGPSDPSPTLEESSLSLSLSQIGRAHV